MPPRIRSPQQTRVASHFDPRPEALRTPDPKASEQLRCSLLSLNKPCALHELVPDTEKINHDHSYSLKSNTDTPVS